MTTCPAARPFIRRAAAACAVVVALGIASATLPSTFSTAEAAGTSARHASDKAAARAVSLPQHIANANAALANVNARVRAAQWRQARSALRTLKRQAGAAHRQAMGLIGQPPTDPESDDPPGPPAVLSTLGLDHRIEIALVPLFNGMGRVRTLSKLCLVVRTTDNRRDEMLNRVIALPAEGAGDDYADGMADTLGQYTQEVGQLRTSLSTYVLSTAGRAALNGAYRQVLATQARVNAAWGGGE